MLTTMGSVSMGGCNWKWEVLVVASSHIHTRCDVCDRSTYYITLLMRFNCQFLRRTSDFGSCRSGYLHTNLTQRSPCMLCKAPCEASCLTWLLIVSHGLLSLSCHITSFSPDFHDDSTTSNSDALKFNSFVHVLWFINMSAWSMKRYVYACERSRTQSVWELCMTMQTSI